MSEQDRQGACPQGPYIQIGEAKHCRSKYVNGTMLNAVMENDSDGPDLVWRPRVSQLTCGGRLESGFENGLKLLTTR